MARFTFILICFCRAATIVAAALALNAAPACASSHGAKSDHATAGHGEAGHGESGHGDAARSEASDAESNGIRLGEFKVRTDYPVEAQKCTVRFVLYASVDENERDEMRRLVAKHGQKVRDNVIIATRLAPLNVFQEPDLARFRRRILIRLRRNLPELTLDNLYISDFGLLVRTL
jgi:hypothetical protein